MSSIQRIEKLLDQLRDYETAANAYNYELHDESFVPWDGVRMALLGAKQEAIALLPPAMIAPDEPGVMKSWTLPIPNPTIGARLVLKVVEQIEKVDRALRTGEESKVSKWGCGSPTVPGALMPFLQKELQELTGAVEMIRRALASSTAKAPALPEGASYIVALGGCRYRADAKEPVLVTEREDILLRSFLARSPLSKSDLANATGMSAEDALNVLRSLKGTAMRPPKYNGMFSQAIYFPGRRGNGSYHVQIRSESTSPTLRV